MSRSNTNTAVQQRVYTGSSTIKYGDTVNVDGKLYTIGGTARSDANLCDNAWHRIITHVNDQRVFEKWKTFEYRSTESGSNRTATVQQNVEKQGLNRGIEGTKGEQGENENRI